MGIFSDKCINPECSAWVPKSAKFCRTCGSPAADADTNCGRCGAVVATSSKFCWKCGVNLADQLKQPLFNNRWVRNADDFAIRVDECDVKGFLIKGVFIEHGTRAMVFQQGRFCGYVEEGRYDLNGFLKKVVNFNQTTPASIVLVDTGDVELHLEAIKLHSKEQVEVDATFKLLLRIKDPEKMFTNTFKSRNNLSMGYSSGSLVNELRSALQTYVVSKSVQELYNNAAIRQEVEHQMQLAIEPILERIGLEMVQLRFIDFFCPTYDPIREKEAKTYVDTRNVDINIERLKLAQRMRKSEVSAETDIKDFIRQSEHESGLKDVIRSDELEKLKRQFDFNHDKELVVHEIEIEGIKDEHIRSKTRLDLLAKIENRNLEHKAQLEIDLTQAKNDLEVKRIKLEMERLESEQDFWEAEKAIELRRKSEMVELEVQEKADTLEAKKLQERSKASAQALLSILDGPAADKIMELEKLRAKEKLTPDQIVAMAAAESPHVAQALAEKYKADASINGERFKQLQDFMIQQERTGKDAADRLERVMNAALQQMGMTATTRGASSGPDCGCFRRYGWNTGGGKPARNGRRKGLSEMQKNDTF